MQRNGRYLRIHARRGGVNARPVAVDRTPMGIAIGQGNKGQRLYSERTDRDFLDAFVHTDELLGKQQLAQLCVAAAELGRAEDFGAGLPESWIQPVVT